MRVYSSQSPYNGATGGRSVTPSKSRTVLGCGQVKDGVSRSVVEQDVSYCFLLLWVGRPSRRAVAPERIREP